VPGERLDWGALRWAKPLLNILLDGVSEVADFQCRQILRENYFRLQVELPEDHKILMDGIDDITLMLLLGQKASIKETTAWLQASGWTDG
jgi:hypothetical protein